MKRRLKVGVVGASGRMGEEITKILQDNDSCELFLAICRKSSLADYTYTRATADGPEAKEVDIWIDFSSPEILSRLLKTAVKHKTPVVSGTTGLGVKEEKALEKAAQQIPVLWAANMSLGVAVINEALEVFSRIPQFDYQIEEFHHIRKKDKPSGTAKSLQKRLQEVLKRELPEPMAIRGGGIFGIHKVHAMSEEEHVEISHTALNRAVFARGAVEAALWLYSRKKGLYSMRDVLYGEKKLLPAGN